MIFGELVFARRPATDPRAPAGLRIRPDPHSGSGRVAHRDPGLRGLQDRPARLGRRPACPPAPRCTWARGGRHEYVTVPAKFALPLPEGYNDVELAPWLCAGIIGFRALERAAIPEGGRLGICGFGGSAHIAAQVTMHQGVSVGDLIPTALEALDRGGILSLAGIHMTDVPTLNYQQHSFYERESRSVTANTRDDAHAFLRFAGEHRIQVSTVRYRLAEADRALTDLADARGRAVQAHAPTRSSRYVLHLDIEHPR